VKIMARRQVARLIVIATLAGAGTLTCQLAVSAPSAWAGTIGLTSCSGYSDGGSDADLNGLVWQGSSDGFFSTSNECPQGRSFQIAPASGTPKRGSSAQWVTTSPPAIAILHALTPVNQVLIDSANGDGFGASFFWDGGSQAISRENNCCGGSDYGSGINRYLGPSHHFGWKVTCQQNSCGQPLQILDVRGVDLVATDNTPPAVVALGSNNVWYQSGRWIRGSGWPASFQASADAGICSMRAIIAGNSIQGPYDGAPNRHSWTQCPTPQTMALALDTTQYANGALPVTLSASDPASPANVSSPATTLHLDNSPVALSLSGPAGGGASSNAGTQYVTASAAAGPSGVAGVYCSVDGGSSGFYPGASARVPVSGIGSHVIVCHAANPAIDPSGQPASSPTEAFNLSIRQPTAAAISFSRIADALRCHGVTVKVHVKGKPRTVKRHGKKVRVPGRTRIVKHRVRRCHARTALRKVTVIVKRDGKPVKITKVRRVALLPHTVQKATRRVGHGKATTVSGFLEVANGTALSGRQVQILSAPDNGLGQFTPMASVATGANGTWTAKVPAGPSRLIEAVYAGDTTTEPATSALVKLIVPARVRIKIRPRIIPWGSRLRITGRVLGGYVPTNSNLLRLNVGIGRIGHLEGLPEIQPNGRFVIVWRFNAGHGVLHPWFSVGTLSESAFPYAPGTSKRVIVTLGEHTPAAAAPPARHHRHRARHHKAKHHKRRRR